MSTSPSPPPPPPPPPFHVQALVDNPHAFAHHESVSQLWATKWSAPARAGTYPFGDGKIADFEPVMQALIATSHDDVAILSDPDAYAAPFMPAGAALTARAAAAEEAGDTAAARDLFLRAAAVYRVARFPLIRSAVTQRAWELGRAAYERAGRLMAAPLVVLALPFAARDAGRGDADAPVHAYLRVPRGERPTRGWPLVLFICGLDGYRTDNTARVDAHLAGGCAVLAVDIPGTADCPAARGDPAAAERLFDSVFAWIAGAGAEEYALDAARVVARGVSTGGHYALRVAHTRAEKLRAAVAHGGMAHWAFDARWIRAQNRMEYPFDAGSALAAKFGFDGAEAYAAGAGRFSLEAAGILDRESCRLLLVNGTEDSVFPVEDSVLVAARGRPKEVRLFTGAGHMGGPGAEEVVQAWVRDVC